MPTAETSTALIVPDQLDAMIKGSSVGPETALEIARTFAPIFLECDKALDDAATIKVEDAACVSEMARARTLRLTLKDIRIRGEKAKTAMKADLVPKGRAIDLVFGKLREGCEQAEKWLLDQEELPQRIEAERQEKLRAERAGQMNALGCDPSVHSLGTMPERSWNLLLAACRGEAKLRQDEERAEKEKAEAAEKAREEELAKTRAENARLLHERTQADEQARIAAAKARAVQEKLQAEKAAGEAEAQKQRAHDQMLAKRRETLIGLGVDPGRHDLNASTDDWHQLIFDITERNKKDKAKADKAAADAKAAADKKLADEARKRKAVEAMAQELLAFVKEAVPYLERHADTLYDRGNRLIAKAESGAA